MACSFGSIRFPTAEHDFQLDAMLREIASRGIWVSTHPDVTQKMGVKEVLHTTRHLGWGTDTHLYRNFDAYHDEFPRRLEVTARASSSKIAAMAARGLESPSCGWRPRIRSGSTAGQ